jgi:predicted membrane protein
MNIPSATLRVFQTRPLLIQRICSYLFILFTNFFILFIYSFTFIYLFIYCSLFKGTVSNSALQRVELLDGSEYEFETIQNELVLK